MKDILQQAGVDTFLQKPNTAVSRNSFARWVKDIPQQAGVDTLTVLTLKRSARCSAAVTVGANLGTILKAAGWTSERTFIGFYKRSVKATGNFTGSVLDNFVKIS